MKKLGIGRSEIKMELDEVTHKLVMEKGAEHAYSNVELTEDGFVYRVSFEKPFDNSWVSGPVEEI